MIFGRTIAGLLAQSATISAIFFASIVPALSDWAAPPALLRSIGAASVTCRGEFCVAIACSGRSPEIYSMAPGGGPFLGAANLMIDSQSWTLDFREDPRVLPLLGFTGSCASLREEALDAARRGRRITISGTNSGRYTFAASLIGLTLQLQRMRPACDKGSALSPARGIVGGGLRSLRELPELGRHLRVG